MRDFYTFLDLHVKHSLNLVPIIAVDYSLANLTFDESCYCMHSLKPGQPNDYSEALKRVHRAYKGFSEYMLAYGFGARTVKGEGPACNLFSMTGDFMDPFIDNEDQLLNSYSGTLKSVKLALPVQFRDIIKMVCDIATLEFGDMPQQSERDIRQIKNYYVLVILMAGVIDDFQNALN